jgi:hypothetical protein
MLGAQRWAHLAAGTTRNPVYSARFQPRDRPFSCPNLIGSRAGKQHNSAGDRSGVWQSALLRPSQHA